MAKLNYSKPLFGICPIPLAGTGGGCDAEQNQEKYSCILIEPYAGDIIFASKNDGCQQITQDATEFGFCYFVNMEDYTIYLS